MPAKDLKELMAWLTANSGKVSQGHVGSGTLAHLCGVYMQTITRSTWTFVPYRGAAAALQDLNGAQIDLICAAPGGSALPLAREGRIKAYAVMAGTRLASAPEIPTADEAGLPGFHLSFWQAMWAPKGTPRDMIATLNAAVVAALADPAVRGKLADLGQVIPPRKPPTGALGHKRTTVGVGQHELIGEDQGHSVEFARQGKPLLGRPKGLFVTALEPTDQAKL